MRMERLNFKQILFFGLFILYSIFMFSCILFIARSDLGNSYLVGFFLMVVLPTFIIFPLLGMRIFRNRNVEYRNRFRLLGDRSD